MTVRVARVWGIFVVAGFVLLAHSAPMALSDDALEMAFSFFDNVRPLVVSFTLPGDNDGTPSQATIVRAATAIATDNSSTYWITVPSALKYPGSGFDSVSFTTLKIANSNSTVEVLQIVEDHSGFFAVLKENQPRQITPLNTGIMLPPHHKNQVGIIYIEGGGSSAQSVISPVFHTVKDTFQLPTYGTGGFTFDLAEQLSSSAIGAPIFHRTVDALTGEPSFVLAGMLIESRLEAVPLTTGRAINSPHNGRLADIFSTNSP